MQDLPVAVRALGEDLILFRTPQGRFGLVYPRCCHRGTTLLYGRVEDHGIALWRKLYRQAINTVQEGGDPPLAFGANEVRIEVRAAALIVPAGDVVAS